jgi:hypothetical protein
MVENIYYNLISYICGHIQKLLYYILYNAPPNNGHMGGRSM